MKVGYNDSITFHLTTSHIMQVTMTGGMATAIRDAISDALLMDGKEVVLVIDMEENFKIQEGDSNENNVVPSHQ